MLSVRYRYDYRFDSHWIFRSRYVCLLRWLWPIHKRMGGSFWPVDAIFRFGITPWVSGIAGHICKQRFQWGLEVTTHWTALCRLCLSKQWSFFMFRSSASSGMNAMATVTVEDFIKPFRTLSPKANVIISKVRGFPFSVSVSNRTWI